MNIAFPPKEFWPHFQKTKGALSCSEAIFLYNVCLQVPDSGLWVEAGTAYGKSALVALLAWRNREPKKFFLLEPEFVRPDFLEPAVNSVKALKREFGGSTTCLYTPEYSTDFLPKFEGYSYLFWDSGSHGSELVDIEKPLIESRMAVGGILAMHDIFSQFSSCTEAYQSLIASGKFELIQYNWEEINAYVIDNDLEKDNDSWHQYPELPHPPNFIGALRRI